MRHTRQSNAPVRAADSAHFHPPAERTDFIAIDAPPSSAILVRFGPGGRTHWHRHPDGQYLYVLSGQGRVQSRGGDVVALLPGDMVYAEPGEEHWHGASEKHSVEHLAFSFGRTEWISPVDE